MIDAEDFRVRATAPIDQVVAMVGEHEAEHHGGRRCLGSRTLALFEMARALEIEPEELVFAVGLVAKVYAKARGAETGEPDADLPGV